MDELPTIRLLLRARWALLVVIAAAGIGSLQNRSDWQFFTWGSRLLFGEHQSFVTDAGFFPATDPGGLHVYANYPILQMGPVSLVLARLLAFGPNDGLMAAAVCIAALGLLTVWLLDRALRPAPAVTLTGGACALLGWSALVHYGHLDDALALTCLAAAVYFLSQQRPILFGVMLGLAAGSKSWAVVLIPLAFAIPRGRRLAVSAAAVVVAATWLPFVIADSGTLDLGKQPLEFHAGSALAGLGFTGNNHTSALRLAQLVGGMLVVLLIVRMRAWWLGPAAAFSLRLLTDPMTYPYYGVALIVAALLVDMRRPSKVPRLALAVTALWLLAEATNPPLSGHVRAVTSLLVLAVVLLWLPRDRDDTVARPDAAGARVGSARCA